MDVPARIFRKIYELVVQKLLLEFDGHDSGDYDAVTSRLWTRRFKESHPSEKAVFKKKYAQFYEKQISQVLLNMDGKGTYFYLAYKRAENNTGNVDIKFERLYKTLHYLKQSEPLLLKDLIAFQNFPVEKMKLKAKELLEEFNSINDSEMGNYSIPEDEEKKPDNKANNFYVSDTILNFNSQSIINLVKDFFHFLDEHEFYKAWLLLSPNFQKNSIWDGDFNQFRWSWMTLDSVTLSKIFDVSIEHNTVNLVVTYFEQGDIVDLQNMVEVKYKATNFLHETDDIDKAIRKLSEIHEVDFFKDSYDENFEITFSKIFLGYLSPKVCWSYDASGKYKKKLTTTFSCVEFDAEMWLINDLGAMQPSLDNNFIEDLDIAID